MSEDVYLSEGGIGMSEPIIAVFDVECTGLLDQLLREPDDYRVHCIMVRELVWDGGQLTEVGAREFYDSNLLPPDGDDSLWTYSGDCSAFNDYASEPLYLVGHNVIEFDFPVLEIVYDFTFDGVIVDTLVMSRKNFPDRPGGHSVESWGRRIGQEKPQQEDWTALTPDVRNRCREDTGIEAEILRRVLREEQSNLEKCG